MMKVFSKDKPSINLNTSIKSGGVNSGNSKTGGSSSGSSNGSGSGLHSQKSLLSTKSILSSKSLSQKSVHSTKSNHSISTTSSANSAGNIKVSKNYISPIDNSSLIPNYNSYKFLIVDDNLINLKILYKILSKIFPNSLIIKLSNSSTILKLIQKEKFDLIFLDIEMPPINGVDISKKIRSSKKFNNMGLIAVTTRSNESDLKIYRKVGIDYTFKKPLNYSLNLILNNIEIILNYRKNQ